MKNLITFIFFISVSMIYSQSSFSDGYKAGFKKGYCAGDLTCISPIPSIAPIPNVGESMESYSDGFTRGVIDGKAAQSSGNSAASGYTPNPELQNKLIQGARDAAPKYNGYTNDVANSFNQVMQYASSSFNNNSNVTNNSNQYSSPRTTLNSVIRGAKFRKKSIKKASKDLLKILLKTGEIKKGDERYLKLKAEADYGYDPSTEKDPVLVAIENYNKKARDEELYGTSDITYFDNYHSGELPLSVDEITKRFKNQYILYIDENGTVLFNDEIDYNSPKKENIKYLVFSAWTGDLNRSEGYNIFFNIDSEYQPVSSFIHRAYDNTGKRVYEIDMSVEPPKVSKL